MKSTPLLQFALLSELNDGRFHSGQLLADRLAVSRAAIWKNLKLLQEQFGLEIHAVSGKGYRLATPIELLDRAFIENQLHQHFADWSVETFFSIDSTNQYLLHKAGETNSDRCVVFAEHQKAGRGRRGRQWISPFGTNLYFSILYRMRQPAQGLMGLSLAVAVAITRALRETTGTEVQVKWPNDILYQGKKLCGILLELHGEHAGPTAVVIGVGLNLRLSAQDREAIQQPSAALQDIGAITISRNLLAVNLLKQVINVLYEFEQRGLSGLLTEWKQHDAYIDQPVQLQLGNKTVTGICRGIDEHGALLMDQQGQLQRYFSGEISLRAAQ